MKIPLLFVHSAGPQNLYEGSGGLISHLRESLGDLYEVRSPEMPDPENPRYELWREQLKKEFGHLKQESILVGHSLGASVLLKYLSEEKYNVSIAALFLVAVPFWGNQEWAFDEFVLEKNFSSRLATIPFIFLYHSRHDDWVPFNHLDQYARRIPGAIVRTLEGHEHEFNKGLPQLITDIKAIYQELNKLNLNL
jgi:predicted alpha/beta hydrolase family esterase